MLRVSPEVDRIRLRHFRPETHPYMLLEREVEATLKPGDVLLDAGCGRSLEISNRFLHKAGQCIGVDVLDPTILTEADPKLTYLQNDLSRISLGNESVDLVVSRSVMEHLTDPTAVLTELRRLLKPCGRIIFLAPNFWEYASLLSFVIPNRFHAYVVNKTEGREEADTFPVVYRCNTARTIQKLGAATGFDVVSIRHLTQYPNYFLFNRYLFLIGTYYSKLIDRFDVFRTLRPWLLVTLERSNTRLP